MTSSMLWVGAESGNVRLVKQELSKNADEMFRTRYGVLPVYAAIGYNHFDCAVYIMNKLHPLSIISDDGMTCLRVAFMFSRVQLAKYILTRMTSDQIQSELIHLSEVAKVFVKKFCSRRVKVKHLLLKSDLIDRLNEDTFQYILFFLGLK